MDVILAMLVTAAKMSRMCGVIKKDKPQNYSSPSFVLD